MSERPNILLIHVDQHRFDCLGINGHPLLRTPHIDGLARAGMNFTHAFCPTPVCAPVRTSLLTGQWPTQHLMIANHGTEAPRPADPALPTFSHCLNQAGYVLGHVGTWDTHPQLTPLDFGFHQYISDGEYPAWRAAQGLPVKPTSGGWFGQADPGVAPDQSRLGWGARQIIGLLEQAAAGAKPFFIRWDPTEPHLPNVVPEPFASMYDPRSIEPWPGFADPLVGKPYIQAQQRRTWQIEGWPWERWAPIVARYLGEVSLLDAQVGRILQALDRLALAEQTLVIYTSDHGDLCGSHGMIDKHFVMYDDVTRVPLVMRWPGRIAPGQTRDAFVAHAIDLAGTFCDVAGVEIPRTFSGQSLLPLMLGGAGNGRGDIFSTYHGNQFGLYSQRMVRERRWKYVWNATAEDELYDLQTDPGEVVNRAIDPACRIELARLRGRLLDWMRTTRDPLANRWITRQIGEGLKV